jgi:hypothetical protein
MSIEFNLYQGESLSRLSRVFALPGQAPVGHQKPRRSLMSAIGEAFEGLLTRLEAGDQRFRSRALERYLAGSVDLPEVERRLRDFERRELPGIHTY